MIKIKFENENMTEIKKEKNDIFIYKYQKKFKFSIILWKYMKNYENKLIKLK